MAGEPVPVRVAKRLTAGPLQTIATRIRTRTSPAKSLALFLLPLPLVLAVVRALVADETGRLTLAAAALACFWTSGAFAWRGLTAEARYVLGEAIDLPAVPWKLVSALVTTAGAAIAAIAGGHSLAGAAMFAALAALGHLCFYGRDMRPVRLTVTSVDGIDVASVTDQLEQASRRLRRIAGAARAIAVPEFRERLLRITNIGQDILGEMARDPRDVSRGRRFLHLYLDSTERITEEYARTHTSLRSRALEDNFRQLLIEMETAFAEQHRRLLESDTLSLDVDIEVLSARLKREGVGDYMEKPS